MKHFICLTLMLLIAVASMQAKSKKVRYALSTSPDSVALVITYYKDKIEIASTGGSVYIAELFSQNDTSLIYCKKTYGYVWNQSQKGLSYGIKREQFYYVSKDRRSLHTEVIDTNRMIYGGPYFIIME